MTSKKKITKSIVKIDNPEEFRIWFEENRKKYVALKDAAIPIITNLIAIDEIECLPIDGRTKDVDSAVEKVTRKNYNDPITQMTDITGIRVIVYLESDVKKVSEIIRSAFNVDEANSSNTDERMSANQVGYRSVHFVCDLGEARTQLPEFKILSGLKFEIQVRTVLQHAWAVMAHDNNYKFTGSLPRPLERHLFLLAALLETADQGFDDLSTKIDKYKTSVISESANGKLDIPVNSLSLESFLNQWAREHNYEFPSRATEEAITSRVVEELRSFGITTLAEIKAIIPDNFIERTRDIPYMTMVGALRIWMLISNPEKFVQDVPHTWHLVDTMEKIVADFVGPQRASEIALLTKQTARHW